MTRKNSRHENILGTIGNTPLVRINRLGAKDVSIYAKLEAFNPMASVKDRLALSVIEQAETNGELKPGQTVIEATSGNTGIGLAMVCAQKGYPLVIVMAENFSVERRRLLRFLGARVVLTPASERGTGMLAKAEELAAKHGWFLTRQFENEANADAHSRTTAPEILEAFEGERLDYWVSGYGTGGTLRGVSRVFKKRRPETQIIACEPDNSALVSSGIEQPFDGQGKRTSHPSARPHPMQGWGPDFIPKLTADSVADDAIDEIILVNGADALKTARDLAMQEGIFCGTSGGATMAAAISLSHRAPKDSTIVCMLPDTGERYMTTALFDEIDVEMNERERAISASTPSCRFDAPPPSAPLAAKPAVKPELDPGAVAELQEILSDQEQPLVMFALEWCEFCWSLRKFFKAAGISYRSIDLDSVSYQAGGRGAKLRGALQDQTSMATIPQVFIGGEFIGGCTETFDAYNDGSCLKKLASVGVEGAVEGLDPYAYLPGWIARRGAA